MPPLDAIENIDVRQECTIEKDDRDQIIQRLVTRIKELELELYGLSESDDGASGRNPAHSPEFDGAVLRGISLMHGAML